MNTNFYVKRRGMTLAGLLIVIAVIGILAAMMMYSSSEAITTAKATQIIANLHMLKRATIEWYVDNNDRVVKYDMYDKGRVVATAGMVIVNNKPKPIQECSENDIQLSRYISGGDKSKINLHYAKKGDSNTGNTNTNLQEGCYGICDGGTVKEPNGKYDNKGNPQYDTTEYHRSQWYVGYCFQEGEEAVRDKIKGMMKTAGVFLGTADAHQDTYNENNVAVWMRVL